MIQTGFNRVNKDEFPIPKIVHLSYKSEEQILPEWKDVIPAWKKTNPSWEIKFWSDKDNEDLVKNEFPWFYDTYKNFKYNIQRADAVRCCYLFKYGGLYIDMDYLPINKIDKLFYNEVNNKNVNDNQIYITLNSSGVYFVNSFMASKPGCEFWLKYLKKIMKVKTKWYWTKTFKVFYTTGPFILTKCIKNSTMTFGFISPKLIHKCDICELQEDSNNNICMSIYFKRIKGQSWYENDIRIFNTIFCNKYKSLLILLIILYILFYFSSKNYICKYSCGLPKCRK
jgi:mannosyltransferase OCH1-like enzyme